MSSMGSGIEIGLLVLQGVQVLFLLLYDWVPLGGLTNLRAVQASDSRGRCCGRHC